MRNFISLSGRSISRKILLAILLVSSIVTTVMTAAQLSFEYFQDVGVIQKSFELINKGYNRSISSSVWDLHHKQLETQLEGIVTNPSILYVEIKNDAELVASAGIMPEGNTVHRTFVLKHKTRERDVDIGQMVIYANLDIVYQKLSRRLLFLFFTQFLKTVILSSVIYLVIQGLLTRHLILISSYLKSLNVNSDESKLELNRRTRNSEDHKDELDAVVNSINQMKNNLRASYQELEVLNHELENRVTEKTETILSQRQQLEYGAKMSALGEMAGGIAHEINTPLATVQLYTEILLGKINEAEIDRGEVSNVLNVNLETTRRIARIIQGLRTFSRNGTNDPVEPASISQIVHHTISLCQERMKFHKIDLDVNQISEDLLVCCREVEISQVLLNILNNAHDAVEDREQRWIRVDVQETESDVEISIVDSGAGIPAEIKEKVFQPFFTTKPVGKGTGLGLSISKGIIDSHKGSLTIDNFKGHTRIKITLPKLFGSDSQMAS